MTWRTKWDLKLKYWFAKTVYKEKDDETPILMDKYEDNGYYYTINNNDHYIYSLDEIYQIAQTNMIDPITRKKIFNHEIVRVRIKQN